MKNTIYLSLIGILMFACQTEQRYFMESPEIDLVQKAIQAYVDGDWETYRVCFADTAKIYSNAWNGGDITPDENIENHKNLLANVSNVEILGWEVGEEPFIEMIVSDEGERWVNTWFLWRGTLAANDQTVDIPVHFTGKVEGGKIALEEVYFNMQPFAEALEALEEQEAVMEAEQGR